MHEIKSPSVMLVGCDITVVFPGHANLLNVGKERIKPEGGIIFFAKEIVKTNDRYTQVISSQLLVSILVCTNLSVYKAILSRKLVQ